MQLYLRGILTVNLAVYYARMYTILYLDKMSCS